MNSDGALLTGIHGHTRTRLLVWVGWETNNGLNREMTHIIFRRINLGALLRADQRGSLVEAGRPREDNAARTRTSVCAQSLSHTYPVLCDPMDCSPPGYSVQGIFQARIQEWVDISSPVDLPDSGIGPICLASPALAGKLYRWITWKPSYTHRNQYELSQISWNYLLEKYCRSRNNTNL